MSYQRSSTNSNFTKQMTMEILKWKKLVPSYLILTLKKKKSLKPEGSRLLICSSAHHPLTLPEKFNTSQISYITLYGHLLCYKLTHHWLLALKTWTSREVTFYPHNKWHLVQRASGVFLQLTWPYGHGPPSEGAASAHRDHRVNESRVYLRSTLTVTLQFTQQPPPWHRHLWTVTDHLPWCKTHTHPCIYVLRQTCTIQKTCYIINFCFSNSFNTL